MAVALHGNLKDFGLAEVFQLIGQQRKTGILEISGNKEDVRLAFDAGSIVWASPVGKTEHAHLADQFVRCGLVTRAEMSEHERESESSARPLPDLLLQSGLVTSTELEEIRRLLTRETIFKVMRLSGGSFHFSAQPVVHHVPEENQLLAEQVLMDSLRMVDEWQTFASQVPDDEAVFERCGQLEAYRATAQGEARHRLAEAERVFQRVDGRLTVRRVIDLSRLGTFEGTRILAELREAGLIQPVVGSRVRPTGLGSLRGGGPRLGSFSIVQAARTVVSILLPMGLLAFLTLQIDRKAEALAALPGTPIPESPLTDLREPFARRALRGGIEAHLYAEGKRPESLEALAKHPVMAASALTPEEAGAYYYVTNEGETLVLAPERSKQTR